MEIKELLLTLDNRMKTHDTNMKEKVEKIEDVLLSDIQPNILKLLENQEKMKEILETLDEEKIEIIEETIDKIPERGIKGKLKRAWNKAKEAWNRAKEVKEFDEFIQLLFKAVTYAPQVVRILLSTLFMGISLT
jgi:Zn-dependent M32 family carboxypeptidase